MASESCSEYVSFHVGSLDGFETDERFDALIGRFVLPYQRDPAATLRRLARLVRPGGIVAFHEMDLGNGHTSWPPCAVGRVLRAAGQAVAGARRTAGLRPSADPYVPRRGLPWPDAEVAGTAGASRAPRSSPGSAARYGP
ncbi:methyltransferase domain-containing protein [Streptomyces sp. M19]